MSAQRARLLTPARQKSSNLRFAKCCQLRLNALSRQLLPLTSGLSHFWTYNTRSCMLNALFDLLLVQILVHLLLGRLCVHNRTRTIEDLCDLLKTTPLSLWKDEICDREGNSQQAAEDDVVLVANVLHADGVTEGCNDQGRIYCEKLTSKSFRSACLSALLDLVSTQQRLT